MKPGTGGAARFRKALLEAADYAMLILGEYASQAVRGHIESIHKVKYEEIPEKPEILHDVLESLFGSGSKAIERLIAKNLYQRLDIEFQERKEWTIVDYVEHAKKTMGTG
ncbi:MAG: hypothetical protein QW828_06235 [Candidatus Bathyarchaeia archaeon]